MGGGADQIELFDRRAVRRHRERAAAAAARAGGDPDFLAREIAGRLVERLGDFNRDFTRVLEFGGVGGGDRAFQIGADLSVGMLARTAGPRVVLDEERLPFAAGSFDLVTSLLALHWVNDLPGALIQINRALRPDGLFLAAMLGGQTLKELRHALLVAEAELEGGASPRVSPFADLRAAGGLLQRAGFAMPVADCETLTVTYPDALALMRDLRTMAETNALVERRKGFTRRATLMAAAAAYQELYAGPDGRLPATFEIIWLTGWAPHPDQPKPLRPGSAKTHFAEAFGQDPPGAQSRRHSKSRSIATSGASAGGMA